MPVLTYKCPACGGALKFNPKDGKFKCEFCDSVFEEEYLKTLDDQKYDNLEHSDPEPSEDKGADSVGGELVYTCPSCGAEIVTDATTAATTCYYCHNPIILTGRLVKELKPNGLIPFKYEKKEAKKRFFEWIKKKRYVPADFISERSLETITGVYYPYWMADYQTKAHFDGEGTIVTTTETRTEVITTTKYYHVMRDGNINFNNIERSALKKNDRKLADGIHPYDCSQIIDFEPSYLSGFMAEKRDVESNEVKQSVEDEIREYVPNILTSDSKYSSVNGTTDVEYLQNDYKYTLLPAWVLTYKGNDGKQYYYSMNGQNGNVCGILPVDKKKLLLHSLLLGLGVTAAAFLLVFILLIVL